MTHADSSDEELMCSLRNGDDLALNSLMTRWQKPLTAFVLRYTKNTSEASDLAQETFVRIYQQRAKYRQKGKFSTWMFTIAANLCRNHARWKSRHPSVAGLEDGQNLPSSQSTDPKDSPDLNAIRDDEADKIRQAVQALPHDLRTAILLFEYENLSYAEIARVLACTPKTVETRLYRARQILREKLTPLL
ncbi:sigma-70 family RNA polymerase sigma factor [Verrucomicrobiaceae bacterium 227]